jgi:hypothetical protein
VIDPHKAVTDHEHLQELLHIRTQELKAALEENNLLKYKLMTLKADFQMVKENLGELGA